jgi:hypothetical protein
LDLRSLPIRQLLVVLVLAVFLLGPAAVAAGAEVGVQEQAAEVTAQRAIAIARKDPVAIDQAAKNPGLERRARRVDDRWEVGLYAGEDKVGLVVVDARSGEVIESWTGYQVSWKMARGYAGAFGRALNAPYVFIPLTLIFLVGLIDWRRLRRLVNLDLVVLCAFSISHIFFNRAEIGLSVPLVYPVMVYLLLRMLHLAFRRGRDPVGLNPVWPTTALLILTLFLVGFRVGLNVVNSGVADIGYASVVGADRIGHGEEVYGNFPDDVSEGDTYGPVTYYAYLPFELVLPWSGTWDNLPAAHAAAIAFDLGVIALLFLLGMRLRAGPEGRRLGTVLAFAWAAFPYTALVLCSNSNDSLVAVLLVAAFLFAARPLLRGAAMAAATLAKFAPLIAVGVLARLEAQANAGQAPQSAPRRWLLYCLGFGIAAAILLAQTAVGPGFELFYERTLGYQAGRDSPFSIWGQASWLEPLRVALIAATGLLALVSLRWPRRLTVARAAALAAALLIAAQMATMHWFYLYIVWFFPLVLIALSGERVSLAGSPFRAATGPGRGTRAAGRV